MDNKIDKVLKEVEEMATTASFAVMSMSSEDLSSLESLLRDMKVCKDRLKAIKKEVRKDSKEKFTELLQLINGLSETIDAEITARKNANV